MTDKAYAVPLHELLASVPREAKLVIDDDDGMGTRFIPVGRYCNEAAEALRARLEKWTADDTAYRPGGLPQAEQELVAWSRVNMNDHKEGDLGIGTKPYAAQAAMVAQQTQERMRIDPVTGDVSIGAVKPQREWQGLVIDEIEASTSLGVYAKPLIEFARAIEAKLKEKNGFA